MARPIISVTVRGRTGIVWEGEVKALSSQNKVGKFDILPMHTNFVSTVSKKLRLHKVDGKIEEINVESGLVHVFQNKVIVFLGIV